MRPLQPQIQIFNLLTWADWWVFTITMLLTALVMMYGHHLKKTNPHVEDTYAKSSRHHPKYLEYFLMGRQLTLPMFVATLVATWYGGILGVTRISFESGIYNFITQGVFWYFTYFIFAFFLVDRMRKYDVLTLPELVGTLYGPQARRVSAVLNFLNVIPVACTISLGLFLHALFGIDKFWGMLLGTLVVTIYTVGGGFRAVVFSDFIQFLTMCSSVVIILIVSVATFGSVDFLRSHLPATHFDPLGGQGILSTFAWGFIALATLVDPNFYQRTLAAKSSKVAKRGILIAIFVWFCFDICTTAGGMYARAVIPQAAPDSAYLIYAMQILPTGLRGFVLAGILTTTLSTLDSYIFVAHSTISYDLCPKALQDKLLFSTSIWRYISAFFVSALSLFLAHFFDGNIKVVWKTLGSYATACLLLPIMYAFWSKRSLPQRQFLWASSLGVCGMTIWDILKHFTVISFDLDALYIGILCSFCGFVLSSEKVKLNFNLIKNSYNRFS